MTGIDLDRDSLAYVAVGDSFTEGVGDPYPDPEVAVHGQFRGWADRFAQRLAESVGEVHYANLAVRGKLLGQVLSDQLPPALELDPHLVTLCAGGNDLLRPGGDPDRLARPLERAVRRLREHGADVVLFTGVNISDGYMRPLIGRFARFYLNVRAIADRHGCYLIDQWSMGVLRDARAWHSDRLHMSPEGHRRVALRVCEVLGVPAESRSDEPWPPVERVPWRAARQADVRWAREFLVPWIGRRLSGRSSGDNRSAKRPALVRVRS